MIKILSKMFIKPSSKKTNESKVSERDEYNGLDQLGTSSNQWDILINFDEIWKSINKF